MQHIARSATQRVTAAARRTALTAVRSSLVAPHVSASAATPVTRAAASCRAFSAAAAAAASPATPSASAAPVLTSNKVFATAADALKASGAKDGSSFLVGGFGVKQMKRMIASYFGVNPEFERQYLSGELEVELTPQGTLAEKLRAGGAGIPAFYTRTAFGTVIASGGFPIKYNADRTSVQIVSQPKEIKSFKGREYVMEESIVGDVALVKAWKADPFGNLVFRSTARNFNPECAMASRFCIAEVEEIVPMGAIDPADVHLPGVYVKAIVKANVEKKIEKRCVRGLKDATGHLVEPSAAEKIRQRLGRRAAAELKDGMNVNLGIGIPTLAANYLPPGVTIMLQSENGLLGMGPYPEAGKEDADLINAGKETVTALPGSSIFSSSTSFGMIRGKHIDISILGGMEVSQYGDLANWIIPGKLVKGMGGAMDLVSSGSRVVITMEHTTKNGKPKILNNCHLPLTGTRCVNAIITELGVFDVSPTEGLTLIEIAPDTTLEIVKKSTEAPFKVAKELKLMKIE